MVKKRAPLLKVPLPFGLTLPVPRWTAQGFGVAALLAVNLFLYRQAFPVTPEQITLKQANAALAQEMEEYQRHLGQTPEEIFADPDGAMRVQVFTDHAVLILRKDGTRIWTRLIPDLAKPLPATAERLMARLPVVFAASQECRPRHHHTEAPARTYGEKRGCAVPVYWTYKDGCQYYQLYDACRQAFEADGDGSPRIHWVVCR
jgi:hypothetical protein